MHIGFIEDTHLHGGTQIWVTEAVQNFIQQGHQVTLLAPAGSWVAQQSRASGARIAEYDWDQVIHESLEDQAIWTEALRDCEVAVCTVHPPRSGFHCSVFAARCIQEADLKTHLIPKTGTIVPEYLREYYLPNETINSSVIAIADFTRTYLIDTYKIPPEKVALIYQGTDLERFHPQEKPSEAALEHYPLPKKASPVLGSIGSFEHRKGHPVLFDAVKELVEGIFPDIHLMMVGDGPDEEMLKQKVKEIGLEDHVSFFPFTSTPNYVYERLDITVLPSLYKEGLPNVLLESMAMEVPVVSSNIGGVSEIVIDGETGYRVEPGNQQALADAIKKLWENQENYRQMRTNAYRLIRTQFNKTEQFNQFLTYFKQLKSTS